MNNIEISQEHIKSVLHYNPSTGLLKWIGGSFRKTRGKAAGTRDASGYICIGLGGKMYMAHRVAWMYVHGAFPDCFIDHINGIKSDNRLSNLREVTNAQNIQNSKISKNNTTGYKGVYWSKAAKKFHARITANKKTFNLGFFDCPKEAHSAYCEKADELHGEFANYGTTPKATGEGEL